MSTSNHDKFHVKNVAKFLWRHLVILKTELLEILSESPVGVFIFVAILLLLLSCRSCELGVHIDSH